MIQALQGKLGYEDSTPSVGQSLVGNRSAVQASSVDARPLDHGNSYGINTGASPRIVPLPR